MSEKVFFVCLFLLNISLGHKKITRDLTKVVGGRPALPGEFPYAVSIQNSRKLHLCGGVLTSSTKVLTACHCFGYFFGKSFVYYRIRGFKAVAGSNDCSQDGTGQVRTVNKANCDVRSIEYKWGWGYDYAFIETEPFILSPTLKIIPIYSLNTVETFSFLLELSKNNTNCEAIGWGAQHIVSPGVYDNVARKLQVLKIKVLNYPTCEKLLCREPLLACSKGLEKRKQVCGIAKDADVCTGDSGGPLVCNGYVVGLTSWGPDCGEFNYPTMFSTVDSILKSFTPRKDEQLAPQNNSAKSMHLHHLTKILPWWFNIAYAIL